MLRTLAGVLERRPGAAGAGAEEALRRAVAAEAGGEVAVVRDGPLLLACSGPAPARDGAAAGVLDGVLDVPVACGPDDPPGAAEAAVLAAWRRDGDAALARLRGDFALVLWDGARGALVRDHLGLRGLHHHDDGMVLRFASEPHVLLALLPATPGPDPHGLAHWLAISAPPGDHTLLDGVRRVPPAGIVDLDPAGRRPARRYWDPDPRRRVEADGPEAARQLRETLSTAVARRSRGPQETGVLLSGGLDSSAVAGVARGALHDGAGPERSYSAVFPEHRSVDESALITQLCEELGLSGVAAHVHRPALMGGVLPYVERFAVPPVSPNLFFWNPLHARAAADGTRILLDGEGGDELYGLSPYLVSDRLRAGRVRAAVRAVHGVPGAHRGVRREVVLRWMRDPGLAGLAPAGAHALSRRLRPGRGRAVPWLGPALGAAYDETAPGGAWKRHRGPRWWAFLVEAVTRTGPSLAYDHQRRRATLAGLLPRHPLVDVDCIQLVLGLPPELAFDPQRSRPVLREAVRGLIPDAVRLRPSKSTFDEVFHAALAGPDLPVARALLGPGARVAEHVDGAALHALVAGDPPAPGAGRQWWALQVWRLLTAECFLLRLEDPAQPRRALERLGAAEASVQVTGLTGRLTEI